MTAGSYIINQGSVLRKTYTLLCLFFADIEISRRSDPNDKNFSLKSLEEIFFEVEASRLLLEIAIAVRVIDDQMNKLSKTDCRKISYEKTRAEVDSYDYAIFDDLNLNLRETCNKIMHSDVMEAHLTEGNEPHESDMAYKHGLGDKEIAWSHKTGLVRLCGTKNKIEWYVLLDVEIFVKGVYLLLSKELIVKAKDSPS